MAKANKKQKPGEEVNAGGGPGGIEPGSNEWKAEVASAIRDALSHRNLTWSWSDRSLRIVGPTGESPRGEASHKRAESHYTPQREKLDNFLQATVEASDELELDDLPAVEILLKYRRVAEAFPPGERRRGMSVGAALQLLSVPAEARSEIIEGLLGSGDRLSVRNCQDAANEWKSGSGANQVSRADSTSNVFPLRPPSRQQADDADDDEPDASGPEPELDDPDDAADELTDEQVSLMKQFVEIAPVDTDTRIEQIVPLVKKDKDTEVIADRLHIREMDMYLDEDIREAINKVDPNYLSTVNRESNGSCATTSPSRRIFDIKYNIDYLFTTMYTLSPRDKRRLRKIAKRILKETKEN